MVVRTFFFQAEDGIRVFHVTGVQTCALPICARGDWERGGPLGDSRTGESLRRLPRFFVRGTCAALHNGCTVGDTREIGRASWRARAITSVVWLCALLPSRREVRTMTASTVGW